MSFDLNVYMKAPSRFSVADCEAYLTAYGLHGHFTELTDPMAFAGPCPFVGTSDLVGDGILYRICPEYYVDEYVFEPAPPRKPTLWERLTGKAPPPPAPERDPFEGASHCLLLSCSYGDSLSIPMAYGIAAYAVAHCGGILYDPQDDAVYADPSAVEESYASCLISLQKEKQQGKLMLHPDGYGMP